VVIDLFSAKHHRDNARYDQPTFNLNQIKTVLALSALNGSHPSLSMAATAVAKSENDLR